MRTKVLTVVAVVSVACQGTQAPGAHPEEVRAARDRFFSAISEFDYGGLRAAVTADYVLIEDGLIWNVDSVVAVLRELQISSTLRYTFQDDVIHIEGPTAWMTYRNRGVLTADTGADTLYWVESAVFRREPDGWRMALLHSTRLKDGGG